MSGVATSTCSSKKFARRKISPPKLVLVYSPSEPIENGRHRRKFPSFKDCCVKISVCNSEYPAGSRQTRVPGIRYECDGINTRNTTINNNSLINGPTYLLGITSITRLPINEETQLLDLPTNRVCLHHPLNYCNVKDVQPGHYGFWFRFFGTPCRFHIMITLKLHKNSPDHVDKVVSTIELDIRNNFDEGTINRSMSMKSSSNKSRDSSLYSEKEYIRIMEKLQNLEEQYLWERCISVGDEILFGLEKGKSDFKVCILLEQSKALCHQGNFVEAKLLVKQALEAIPTKSQNKDLLIGRAYIYLSLCHHYDLSLGNAEECLRLASEKLTAFRPCEDTANLHYNEGRLLLSFLLTISNFNKGLVNEAKEKIEKAISHFRDLYNSKCATIVNKICNAQLTIAMLLLFANLENDNIVIAEKIISTMTDKVNYLDLSKATRCRFSFAKALLLQQEGDKEAAITEAKHALNLAENCGLYVEKQLIVKCLKRFLEYM